MFKGTALRANFRKSVDVKMYIHWDALGSFGKPREYLFGGQREQVPVERPKRFLFGKPMGIPLGSILWEATGSFLREAKRSTPSGRQREYPSRRQRESVPFGKHSLGSCAKPKGILFRRPKGVSTH